MIDGLLDGQDGEKGASAQDGVHPVIFQSCSELILQSFNPVQNFYPVRPVIFQSCSDYFFC